MIQSGRVTGPVAWTCFTMTARISLIFFPVNTTEPFPVSACGAGHSLTGEIQHFSPVRLTKSLESFPCTTPVRGMYTLPW
jgi:hypothetical protein